MKNLAIVFVRQLGERVGRERLRQLRFHPGQRGIIAVGGGRGGHDDPLHVRVARGQQNVQRAIEIDQGGLHRIFHRTRHGRERGEVDDVIHSRKQRTNFLQIANVRLPEIDLVLNAAQVFFMASGEIVENADGFAAPDQLLNHV